ncbi:MAG TPA: LutB/LldF family L-lactate oxidation iron-sulfur protein [Methyloceanibacter sp.]
MGNGRQDFKTDAAHALADTGLQRALQNVKRGFVDKRKAARAKLPEFDTLREDARAIKDHTLSHLDLYLETYERKVTESGGSVHYAPTAADARAIILKLCQEAGAKLVTKGKSMVSEEIGLNAHLQAAKIEVVETDLGEYIVQLRGERPSHIIAPVIHLNKETIEADFRRAHHRLPRERRLDQAQYLVAEARKVLREKFLAADVGITGANLLIAETGSSVIVTNEGNGDLTSTLPRMHIVIASIEKIVPTLEDAMIILRLLARSATGQEITTYTTFATGPRHDRDPDGPGAYHVVLLDNGRSEMLGNEFADMLRCIRCGACLNHCPVYGAIGGHAYGSVYPGPMGAVLTPQLQGIDRARDLPHASSFCGRCEAVCPMDIPLPDMMRTWRERDFARGNPPFSERLFLKMWAYAAKRPLLYHALANAIVLFMARRAGASGRLSRLPLATAWTGTRDLPAPQGRTFHSLYARARRKGRP